MKEYLTLEEIREAVQAVRSRTTHNPQVGLILGSGLGGLADLVEQADYVDIVIFPTGLNRR